ncbi:hypothetical protein ACN47E_003977 [Coniothyrium glycines]
MCTMSPQDRTYPLRKPKNHRLPVPRYTLELKEDIGKVYTLYIGVQEHTTHEKGKNAAAHVIEAIHDIFQGNTEHPVYETFTHIEGQDAQKATIWVCYWTSVENYNRFLSALNVQTIYFSLPADSRSFIGLWLETFSTSKTRLETNYSGLDYLPGLARLPNTTTKEHDLATYWGAARDRIPDSAHDLFPSVNQAKRLVSAPSGIGQYNKGTNPSNMVHIRSGQFWENCTQEETEAYEQKLEPALRGGLQWLREYPDESGASAVRYLRNTSSPLSAPQETQRKETCGAAFFRNLADLEKWAKSHKSHLAIYGGALKHYKAFPENRMMRTWHEVSVLREGEARFEYVNCLPGTGVLGDVEMEVTTLEKH